MKNYICSLILFLTCRLQTEGLSDVCLGCSDGSLRAHKLILSTCSDYFLVRNKKTKVRWSGLFKIILFVFKGHKFTFPRSRLCLVFLYWTIDAFTAQWSSCQLGCFCNQNFPCISGSCYRSISSELEFENHKYQYFSWLLRSEHVKINIFGNRMTKLTIWDWSELVRF